MLEIHHENRERTTSDVKMSERDGDDLILVTIIIIIE
jgi:hypothetical protein